MEKDLTREQIIKLFDELSRELRFEGARAQIYIIGGAAMSLAFDRDRATKDVDARVDSGHTRLTQAARKMARRHGLPETWLNEQATAMIPRAGDVRAQTVYESAYLTVTGASAKHLLAMKLAAGRDTDADDIAVLCKELQLGDVEEAVAIHRELFPGERLKGMAREILEKTFRNQDLEPEQ